MFKLTPVLKHYLWGGTKLKELFSRSDGEEKTAESWEVSVHPDGASRCGGGTLAEYLSAHPEAVSPAGGELPVLIKYIDAADDLSVQVHPDDGYARRTEGDNGKTEMWYIIDAAEGAGIYLGFKRDVTREELEEGIRAGTVGELLNFIPVKAGDCYLVKAGTVHAIGAGCVICEVQQSSNVTYRVYDYCRRDANGNLRPLHIQKALDVIDLSAFRDKTGSGAPQETAGGSVRLLTSCKYFRCRELLLDGVFSCRSATSFLAVNVLEGEGEAGGVPFRRGDSFFVPRGEKLVLRGSGKLLLTDRELGCYAGIDLGGTFVKCGIVDETGRILAKKSVPTGKERPYREIVRDMAEAVKELAEGLSLSLSDLRGAGVGSPGTVDSARGTIVYSNNIRWENVPLGPALSELLGMPVSVTNDANAAALGECFCGAGAGYRDVVLVTLGTGVGGGIVIGGKLYEGGRSAGTEIGHEVIRAGGERCTCGRRGCFEAYASATALIRKTVRAMERHPESALHALAPSPEAVDGKTAFDGLRMGDRTAKRVVAEYVRDLAEGLANVANVFRPQVILLGGGICKEGETLLAPLRRQFEARLYGGGGYAPVALAVASLGNDAGLCGAARLAMMKK